MAMNGSIPAYLISVWQKKANNLPHSFVTGRKIYRRQKDTPEASLASIDKGLPQ